MDGGGEDTIPANNDETQKSAKKAAKRVRYTKGESANVFADRVCSRVFVDDISEQAAMKDLWTERAPPSPIDITAICNDNIIEGSAPDMESVNLLEQRVWSRDECARVLRASLIHMVRSRPTEIGSTSFDKDDREALAFVVAAANLRASAYGVPLSSAFEVKGIAGNIIHAVATTNAVVGGLVVLEALKVITSNGKLDKCRTTYVTRKL